MDVRFQWVPLLVALCLTLVTISLAALRFKLLVEALGSTIDYRAAISVVVWGGVANILPLPGAFLVRVGVLAQRVGVRRSTLANVAGLAIWFFAAAAFALALRGDNGSLLLSNLLWLVAGLSLIGTLILIIMSGMFFNQSVLVMLLQLVMTGINVVRLVLISWSVGLDLPAFVAALFSLSGVAAAATGFFPSGIGLGEALASGISLYVGISAALGFIVTALNRLIGWVALAGFIPFIQRNDGTKAKE